GELTGRAAGQLVPLGDAACVIGSHPAWHTLVTSMFLHASWFHLISNLWFLWIFGDNIEDAFGRLGFLAFYLASGLAAAGAEILATPGSTLPMVGASGAVSGVMGAYIVRYPRVPVQTLLFLGIFITRVRVPAYVMLGYWFVLQVLGGLPQLFGDTAGAGVAFWAHVGGFATGAVVAALVPRGRARPAGRRAGRSGESSPWLP
ncbi:MAG TPA: rhomboid family intramembrane serine protease, partial [Kofleriaceae bacterium]|nr:rhomboid family intramembrane serine protease [Kofleriaceae bacterium]